MHELYITNGIALKTCKALSSGYDLDKLTIVLYICGERLKEGS
jgi:hypothetical protein